MHQVATRVESGEGELGRAVTVANGAGERWKESDTWVRRISERGTGERGRLVLG